MKPFLSLYTCLLTYLFLCIIAIQLLTFSGCSPQQTERLDTLTTESYTDVVELEKQQIVEFQYGIIADTLCVHFDTIQRNEFLSDMLLKYNVPYVTIDALARASKEVFDVRKLRAKQPYVILADSSAVARYFIYESGAEDYVVFELSDSLNIYKCEKDIQYVEQFHAGVIYSSLYMSMKNNGINPLLSLDLSDIFAWSVDFFRVQKGDSYKAVYEEKFVNGKSVGLGDIKAAYFQHAGEAYYAISFEQNGTENYYDEKGQSTKKAFLKAPLKYSRISSGYTKRRYHPVLKRTRAHLGTDYAAPRGTPIRAIGDGTVIAATYSGGNGRYVKIRHNSVYSSQYLHMSKYGKGIRRGVRVSQGQVIGYVGSTGLATGPHLCFRLWKNGRQINHLKEKFPPAKSVEADYMEAYECHRDSMKTIIDAISFPIQFEDLEAADKLEVEEDGMVNP